MADRVSGKSGASRLAQLLDVLISAPTANQQLFYNAGTGKWVNNGPYDLAQGGTYTAVGDGTTKSFTVTIPALFVNSPTVVIALNSNSSGFLTSLPTVQVTGSASFILNFVSAPASGTHYGFNWIAVGT